MRLVVRSVTGALSLALLVSCNGQPDGTVPDGRVHETVDTVASSAPTPRIVLLVVDDDPAASTLRSDVVEGLGASLERLDQSCAPQGQWRGRDMTVVVARPSAAGSARWIGPPEDARLGLRDVDVTDEEETELLAATSAALDIAPAAGPNQILATAHDGLALLLGEREPADDAEAALVASLPTTDPAAIDVVVASLREDESPGAIETYVPSTSEGGPPLNVTTIFSSIQTACSPPMDGDGRLAEWKEALSDASATLGTGIGYPCGRDYMVDEGLLSVPIAGCGAPSYLCSSHPVAVDEAGRARCFIEVRLRDTDAACDPERGWLPADEPLGQDAYGPFRRCIMQHVPDEDLVACTTDPTYSSCEGCASGFCPHAVPGPTGCVSSEHASIRFVGGAVAGVDASFEIRCRLEP